MLPPSEFKQRRKRLARLIKKKSVALIASAPASVRNRDVEFPFRQDSDFHYLTGFDEPDAVAVLAPGRKQGEYILFCREFDPEKAIWTGKHSERTRPSLSTSWTRFCPDFWKIASGFIFRSDKTRISIVEYSQR